MPIKSGDRAPDVSLLDQDGEPFSLADSLARTGASHLVFFYPKADTPGCTQQACGLRDVADQLGDTVVVGISPDAPARQRRFADKFELGYTLLADIDHAVAEAFGVWKEKKNYGRTYMGVERSAFLISPDGTVAEAWPKISPKDTPTKLLAALDR